MTQGFFRKLFPKSMISNEIWNFVRLETGNHYTSHDLAFDETVSLKLISGERQIKIIPIFNSDLEQF